MAIVVNKEEKRRAIAMACEGLLLERGIRDITIAQIAEKAGIGKGTIYEYFANKDDIVFEIITLFIEQHIQRLRDINREERSTKEKLVEFFSLLHNDGQEAQLALYREFIAISLLGGTEEMVDFSMMCHDKFVEILRGIIHTGIERGEIIPQTLGLVDSWMIYATGLVVNTKLTQLNAKEEIRKMIDNRFEVIKTKGME